MTQQGRDAEITLPFDRTGSAPAELSQLGAYRIVRLLGRGSFGAVHEAHHPLLGRVALKVLSREGEAEIRSFVREGSLVLDHPAIPRILDVGEADGARYLAMTLVEGSPLEALMEAGGLPEARVVEIGARLAEVIAYTHARGVVHRDLKPRNVMVSPGGEVHVLDFGIARVARVADDATGPVGTPAFMAPEQARGEETGTAADVYAMGALLYWLATGRLPVAGDTPEIVLVAVASRRPDPITAWRGDLSPAFAALVGRLMAAAPADRPAAADAARTLAALRSGVIHTEQLPALGRAMAGAGGMLLLAGSGREGVLASTLRDAATLGFAIASGRARDDAGALHALDGALGTRLSEAPARAQLLGAFRAELARRAAERPLLVVLQDADLLDDGVLDVLRVHAVALRFLPILVVLEAPGRGGRLAEWSAQLEGAALLEVQLHGGELRRPEGGEPPLDEGELLAHARAAFRLGAGGLALDRYRQLIARPGTDASLVVEAELRTGVVEAERGDRVTSRAAFERAAARARERPGDELSLGRALYELSRLDAFDGRIDASWDSVEAALAIARRLGDRALEASCENGLGIVHLRRDEAGEAEAALARAASTFEEVHDEQGRRQALSNRAVLLVGRGRIDEARAALETCLAIARASGDARQESVSLCNLGSLNYEAGEHREARRCYEASIALHRYHGDDESLSLALYNMGGLMRAAGELEASLATEREALLLARRAGNLRYVANCLEHLGVVHLDLGSLPEAEAHLQESLEIRRRQGHETGAGWSLLHLAIVHRRQGRPEAARACLLEARAIERSHVPALLALSLDRFEGHAAALDGEPAGHALLARTIARADELGFGEIMVEARIDAAEALVASGDAARGREIAREAAEMAQARGLRRLGSAALRIWESVAP